MLECLGSCHVLLDLSNAASIRRCVTTVWTTAADADLGSLSPRLVVTALISWTPFSTLSLVLAWLVVLLLGPWASVVGLVTGLSCSALPLSNCSFHPSVNNDVSLARGSANTTTEGSFNNRSLSLCFRASAKARQFPMKIDDVVVFVCLDIPIVDTTLMLAHESSISLPFGTSCHLLVQSADILLSPLFALLFLLAIKPISLCHLLLEDCGKRLVRQPVQSLPLLFLHHLLPQGQHVTVFSIPGLQSLLVFLLLLRVFLVLQGPNVPRLIELTERSKVPSFHEILKLRCLCICSLLVALHMVEESLTAYLILLLLC